MKCPKCGEVLVESNITFENIPEDVYYTRLFCFRCDTLFEISSQSGDFVEENLCELGEVEYQ